MRKISFIDSIESYDIPNIGLVVFADRMFLATLCNPINTTYNLYSITRDEEQILEYGEFYKRDLEKITKRPPLVMKFDDEEIITRFNLQQIPWRKL